VQALMLDRHARFRRHVPHSNQRVRIMRRKLGVEIRRR
jgi:hypothetical protein